MDKNARIPTKTSRGRGWRNQKRPDQQFYVPGALHRKKQEQNTDNTEENIREQSRGTTEALQETRKQNYEDCIKNVGKLSETSSNSSNCTTIDENSENKKENMADQSLSSELASGHSDSKSFELKRNSVEILSCAAQCDDQEQSAKNKGEKLGDQTIQIPTLVTEEFKYTEVNVCNTNKLEKNTECSSKTDANCPAQTLSCEVSNAQGLVLSKSTCTQTENPSEHRKTVDISAITTKENTGLDNRAERTTINDLKESSVILSLHNNKTSNESLEKLKDNVKNQHEKDLVTSKEIHEKCINIEDTMQVNKDSENIKEYDEVQADNLHSSSLRKEEIQQGGCVSICEPISNDITKKGIFNSERTEIQSEQTSNDNTDKSKDIDDTEPKKVQTKESVREDEQQCNFEKTSNSQSLADGDLKNENALEQRTHLCSEEKKEIVSTNEIDNTSCSEILETLEETVDNHNQNNDVSTERKAKITYIEDEIKEKCTEKSDSMVSENKEEQPSKLEKVKKKKKSKKSDHLESKEVKKKKKNKKEHCESSKDEESGLNDKKAKCISKTQVKGKQEGVKEEALDQDGKQTGEDDSVDDDDDDDSDSWLNKFNDDGECLDPELIKELSKATGIKKPVKHKTQFDFYSLAEKDMELDDGYGHIVEIYDFSADLKTQDLTKALSVFKDQGYELKWVDDTHALAAFASPLAANQAIQMCSSPLLKLRPVSQGIADSKKKAKRCFEFLQPYKPRPQTTKLTAHMLVTGALGVKSRMTKEEKQKEKDKLKEAREQKRQEKQRKADIWGD